jgi:hypothetical protein
VTRLVHGDARRFATPTSAAEKLFKGDLHEMSEAELLAVFSSVPSSEMSHADARLGNRGGF